MIVFKEKIVKYAKKYDEFSKNRENDKLFKQVRAFVYKKNPPVTK